MVPVIVQYKYSPLDWAGDIAAEFESYVIITLPRLVTYAALILSLFTSYAWNTAELPKVISVPLTVPTIAVPYSPLLASRYAITVLLAVASYAAATSNALFPERNVATVPNEIDVPLIDATKH